MASVKNRVRNKLFKCFRPAAIDDDSTKPGATDGSGNLVFTSISGKGKSRKISNSLSGEKGKVYSEGGDAGGGDRGNKEGSHRSFSAAVKAVLFDASLTKKTPRNRKARQISNSSNINMSSEISQKVSKSSHDHEKPSKRDSSAAGDWKTNYNYWSSSLDSSFPTTYSTDHSLSSSRVSSLALDSTPWLEHKESFRAGSAGSKRIDRFISTDDVREYRRVDIGLCMFLVSFSVLIFWGREYAQYAALRCCLLLFDGPDKRIDSARCRIELPEIGSEEHKKKVIMEGLLERNHSRLL
ncbi:uncharacterized protein LOC131322780 [Rhododendron vialii]|uniref:uncharacterized protein LOC131322780 n=1 Tax=Rhododendron vialii TaxID=182163 RepID=UPI00265F4008|nr:uncharacterized protein LOC131322780 [Rhododendron vialii]